MNDIEPVGEHRPSEIHFQPHSREAEEAVLGSVLINPEVYYDVSQFLKSDDFFIVRNRWVWEVFEALNSRRVPVDYLVVCNELEQKGQLEEIGGIAYISSLTNQTPTSINAESYAHIIEEKSLRRRMLIAANEMAQLAYNENQGVEIVLGEAEKAIFGLSERRSQHGLQPIKQVLGDVFEHVAEMARVSDDIFGVPSGLHDLDHLLGGMQKSDLLIVAGRPGAGKTGFLLSVAKNAAQKHKKHVALFSLEMSNEQLVQRLIAQETGIDTQRLRAGKLSDKEWDLFNHAIGVLEDANIFLDDTPAITPLQLHTKCRRLDMEHHLDLVIVDYLQLMSGDQRRNENRVQEVSSISRSLKALARDLDVPVLSAAQLSRAVEQRSEKIPVLSDLRESGSLEQDADVVMFINRPDMMDKESSRHSIAQIIVAKHRNGPTHSGIELIFHEKLARFENAATKFIPQ